MFSNETIKAIWLEYKIFVLVTAVVLSLRIILLLLYKKRRSTKGRDSFVIGINNATFISMGVIFFFLTLHLFGITIREFFTSITIFAAALAIVFKDYILNGLNGMLIMFGDNYQIGDYVQIGQYKGRIDNITLLNTQILTDEEDLVLVPNTNIVNSEVINYSKNPRHHTSIDFELQSAQVINVSELETRLHQVLAPFEPALREGSIKLRVVEFKKDIVHYRFRFGLLNYDATLESSLKQKIWSEILLLINSGKPSA